MLKKCMLALVLAVAMATPARAQDLPDQVTHTRISGYAFGDAYFVAANHNPDFEQLNGLWIRRAYLTFDSDLSDDLAFRMRLEMNSPGDFSSDSKLNPHVKDLYVRWSRSDHQILLGISPTPTWAVVEPFWGYRSVEKTAVDLQKMGSARDFGVAVRGRVDGAGVVRYHAMIANGSGTRGETNRGKKAALSFSLHPDSGFLVEVYGDYEGRPNNADRATMHGFLGWQNDRGRIGFFAARQWREVNGGVDLNLDVVSIFGTLKLGKGITLLARYDRMLAPNPDADSVPYLPMAPTSESTLMLAGIDFTLHEHLHLIPNVETVIYSDRVGVTTPGTDVIGRVTFFVTF